MRPPVVLHSISSFEQDTLESAAVPIIAGLASIASETPLWNEITKYPDFWSILQRLHLREDAAAMIFELLQKMVQSEPPVISADNYESAVSLANDFANSGSIVALNQLRDTSLRRSKSVKRTNKVQYVLAPQASMLLNSSVVLTRGWSRDNPLVIRGTKAIGIIYHMTARIPVLISQSHLEQNEGMRDRLPILALCVDIFLSMGGLLVSDLQCLDSTVHQPLSGYQAPSNLRPSAVVAVSRTCIHRSQGMGGDIWRGAVSVDSPSTQTRGVSVRPCRYE